MGNTWNRHNTITTIAIGLLRQKEKTPSIDIRDIIKDLKDDLKLTPWDMYLLGATLIAFETHPKETIKEKIPDYIKKYLETEEGKKVSQLLAAYGITL